MEIRIRIDVELKGSGDGGDGEERVLYCPLCRARGERVRMRPGKLLIRSPHVVLQPRPWFALLRRWRWLRWAVELPPVARLVARHERWFYRLYFAPYRRVEGYLCEAVAGHGLTRETYLKALLGRASPAAILSEMEEIQAAHREQRWSGLHLSSP